MKTEIFSDLEAAVEDAQQGKTILLDLQLMEQSTPYSLLLGLRELVLKEVSVSIMDGGNLVHVISPNDGSLIKLLAQSAVNAQAKNIEKHANSKNTGRPEATVTHKQLSNAYNALKDSTFTKTALAKSLKISRPTLNKLLKDYEENEEQTQLF